MVSIEPFCASGIEGGTMASVVKITTFLTDVRHRVDLAPVREELFGKKSPASTRCRFQRRPIRTG